MNRIHEEIPLGLIENEACLIGEGLLGFLAGALDDEIRYVDATAFRSYSNQIFLLGGCPKVEFLRFGFVGCSNAHGGLITIVPALYAIALFEQQPDRPRS